MSKLELKHLAPYLPYELKVSKLHTLHINEGIGSVKHILTTESDKYKPILRPLSDLKNYNNDIFKLQKFYNEVTLLFSFNFVYELSVWEYDFLIENHFDVFGLIPNNLAIDINTLEL